MIVVTVRRGLRFDSVRVLSEVFTFDLALCSRLGLTFSPPGAGVLCRVVLVRVGWRRRPGSGPVAASGAVPGQSSAAAGVAEAMRDVAVVPGMVMAGLAACLWSGGEGGECLAAPAAGFRREAGGGPAGVFGLACVVGVEDPLVAGDDQGGGEERDGGDAGEPAPAAADVVAGGVLGGGEGPFGGGAAGVGAAVRF